jgi:hypothetical protein
LAIFVYMVKDPMDDLQNINKLASVLLLFIKVPNRRLANCRKALLEMCCDSFSYSIRKACMITKPTITASTMFICILQVVY